MEKYNPGQVDKKPEKATMYMNIMIRTNVYDLIWSLACREDTEDMYG